jgi:CRISPR-associated protein Csx17
LKGASVGQFHSGGVGGPNGVQGSFEAASRVNPWDYVLMVEGAILFAGSVARRLGATAAARAAFPFTVDSVAVGYGSAVASEETTDSSRAELWLPLWERPGTLAEVTHLFAEGRAQIGRRQAANAVEFALAANLLGVNRGVTAFTRYGFLKRNGLAFLATPLGQLAVTPRPSSRLLDDPPLRDWLDSLRRACRDKDRTPARYQTALRQIDRSMFEFATRSEQGNDATYLLRVLAALGRAERTLASGLRFCKKHGVRPLQGLSPQWLRLSPQDDADAPEFLEFRLAAALAGVGRTNKGEVGALRTHLEEVEQIGGWFNWSPGCSSAVWSKGSLAVNIAAVYRRRLTEAFREGLPGAPLRSRSPARLDDIAAFLNGETDDDALHDLLWGLIAVDWRKVKPTAHQSAPQRPISVEYGIPRLVVEPHALVCERVRQTTQRPGQPEERLVWRLSKDARAVANAKLDPDVFHLLASGQAEAVEQCVTRAARRLKSGGLLVTGYRNRRLAGRPVGVVSAVRPDRLLAAMLFPLSRRDRERLAKAVLYPPEREI